MAVNLMCEVLGVSRGGFYTWVTRPPSERIRKDEQLAAQVRQSFLRSDRTYGARRVWHDVLEQGLSCGLHRIERLMREQALRTRPRRRGLPTDRGTQYTSEHFQQLLKEQGIICSMSRAGEVWDNSAMENFFSSLKTERTSRKVYRTRAQARLDVFDYIERFYNSSRRHSKLRYVSPVQFEEARKA